MIEKIILILAIFMAGSVGFVSAQEKDQNQARGGALPPGGTTAFKKIIIEESNRPSEKSPYERIGGTLPPEEQQKFIKYYEKKEGDPTKKPIYENGSGGTLPPGEIRDFKKAFIETEDGRKFTLTKESDGEPVGGTLPPAEIIDFEKDALKVEFRGDIKLNQEKILLNEAEVRVMPHTALEVVESKLKFRVADNTKVLLTSLLDSDGKQNPVYEVLTAAESRIFGIFKVDIPIKAQIDAQSGALKKVSRPWWRIFTTSLNLQAQIAGPTDSSGRSETTRNCPAGRVETGLPNQTVRCDGVTGQWVANDSILTNGLNAAVATTLNKQIILNIVDPRPYTPPNDPAGAKIGLLLKSVDGEGGQAIDAISNHGVAVEGATYSGTSFYAKVYTGYGFFQNGPDAKNYFAGKIGIGTMNPTAQVHIQNGDLKISSLSGNGNAYACLDTNGLLFRSLMPCN